MGVLPLFDGFLCLGLLGLAWSALSARGLFRSVLLFMVFGLLMAVAWARLDAPDLALAEAIIGAGITGALLLNACKSLVIDRGEGARPGRRRGSGEVSDRREPPPGLPRPLLALLCSLLGIGLAWLFSSLQPDRTTARLAEELVPEHVLSNPVTAVLLDFRGYDTLLEMAVLLLAFLGARLLNLQGRLPELYPADATRSVLLDPLVAMMLPVMLLTSAYLFWAGSERPGGAFQAGALLGAAGILLRFNGRLLPVDRQGVGLRGALVLGLLAFSLFALAGWGWGGHPMAYPHTGRYFLMVAIEGCLTVSIAMTLVMLFADAPAMRLRRYR